MACTLCAGHKQHAIQVPASRQRVGYGRQLPHPQAAGAGHAPPGGHLLPLAGAPAVHLGAGMCASPSGCTEVLPVCVSIGSKLKVALGKLRQLPEPGIVRPIVLA